MAIAQQPQGSSRHWSAEELRKMGPDQRNAVLLAAAEAAEEDYHVIVELTDFNAFGEGDLHGDSSNAEPR